MISKSVRSHALLTLVFSLAFTASFAQTPAETTYKAKCQMCHGADGMAQTPAGKAMKTLPFNDPQILNASDADLIASTKNGKGKMPAYNGKLSDAEIKSLIAFVHTLQKK